MPGVIKNRAYTTCHFAAGLASHIPHRFHGSRYCTARGNCLTAHVHDRTQFSKLVLQPPVFLFDLSDLSLKNHETAMCIQDSYAAAIAPAVRGADPARDADSAGAGNTSDAVSGSFLLPAALAVSG